MGRGRKPETARQSAMRFLAVRALTAWELRGRLRRSGHPEDDIDRALETMRLAGYIDDRKLAYNALLSRSKRLRLGRQRLEAELRRRGVSEQDLRAAWELAKDGFEEEGLLAAALAAFLKVEGAPRDSRSFERLARRLVRRGFPESEVLRALRSYRPADANNGCDDIV